MKNHLRTPISYLDCQIMKKLFSSVALFLSSIFTTFGATPTHSPVDPAPNHALATEAASCIREIFVIASRATDKSSARWAAKQIKATTKKIKQLTPALENSPFPSTTDKQEFRSEFASLRNEMPRIIALAESNLEDKSVKEALSPALSEAQSTTNHTIDLLESYYGT